MCAYIYTSETGFKVLTWTLGPPRIDITAVWARITASLLLPSTELPTVPPEMQQPHTSA